MKCTNKNFSTTLTQIIASLGFSPRRSLVTFLMFVVSFANIGIVSIVRAQSQKEKTAAGTFPVPIKWDSQRLTLGSKPESSSEALSSGLTANTTTSGLMNDIQTFLAERSLIPSDDVIKITSERGELIGRLLTEAPSNTASPPDEDVTRFLAYGQIDGTNYAFMYEFVFNKYTKQLLKGAVTNLEGNGYEADYQSGQLFALNDAGAQVTPLASLTDINCLIKNILSCSNLVTVGGCILTLGSGCLYDFLKTVVIDLACGITLNCQPLSSPDFSLNATPTIETITQGQSAHYLIGTDQTGGFTGSISGFSVSNLPSGASASFNANSIISAADAVTLTVATNVGTATGTRTLTIKATGGGKTRTKDVVLVVNPVSSGSVATLSNGQAVNDSVSHTQMKHYKIAVPASATQLKVEMTGTNDADLYLKKGSQASLTNWDCRPYVGGSSEQCTVNSPATGDYFMMVHGYSSAPSSYTLKATYTVGGGGASAPNISKIIVLTNPVPSQQFIARIEGSGFEPSTARVVATGPGCSTFGACVVPNNVINGKSSTVLSNVPLTLAAGVYQIFVQNGNSAPASNPFALTVSSSGGVAPTLVVDGVVSQGGTWPGTSFNVPAGKSLLKVVLSWSGSDDIDLYLTSPAGTSYGYQGTMPSGYSYGVQPEVMQIQNPQSGSWNVKVKGYSVSGSRTFTVTVYIQ